MTRARSRGGVPAWLLNGVIVLFVTTLAVLWVVDSVRADYTVPTEVTAGVLALVTAAIGGRLAAQPAEEDEDDQSPRR